MLRQPAWAGCSCGFHLARLWLLATPSSNQGSELWRQRLRQTRGTPATCFFDSAWVRRVPLPDGRPPWVNRRRVSRTPWYVWFGVRLRLRRVLGIRGNSQLTVAVLLAPPSGSVCLAVRRMCAHLFLSQQNMVIFILGLIMGTASTIFIKVSLAARIGPWLFSFCRERCVLVHTSTRAASLRPKAGCTVCCRRSWSCRLQRPSVTVLAAFCSLPSHGVIAKMSGCLLLKTGVPLSCS